NSDASDDEPAVTAAGAAGIAASGQAKAQGPQTARNTQAPGQPASPQAGAQAAGQTAADPTADNQAAAAPAGQANAQASDAQAQAATQNPDLQPQSDAVQQGVPTKPWQAKTQSVSDAKTDSSQTAKTDDVKQAVTPDPQAVAANDMPQTKPVDASGNVASIIGGTTPQTQGAQNNAAPTVTQNVQVSTPTPNMPALAVEIAAKSQSGAKQFDIRLDPPELGRVEVRLSIDATGKASAHLSADQPQTLDLLQKDAPTLTRALRDAGLNVSQNGLNFSLRQQSSDAGAGGNQSRGGGNGRSFTLSATSSIDATSASAAYRAPADGRLDIRV
ncbi:MAG TPA: flagellar hook-length control protein FliK, partial [Rhizomicrobium sp.]|nr:flagellar hook-length control protein FliK [Rhizomicrobium sp.]